VRIETTPKGKEVNENFAPLLRLWHWLTVAAVTGLYFTVLLRETFLDKKAVAAIVQNKLQALGVSINGEEAVSIAKAIRAPMWEWHYIFAYGLALAIVVRIVAMLRGEAKLPLLKVLQARGVHEKGKAAVHLGICFMLTVMTLTGFFYYFHDALGFDKDSIRWVKEVHETLMLPLAVLIVAHIGGVVMHEIKTKEPIVSKMIHGDTIDSER
jgi:cytochrome b561